MEEEVQDWEQYAVKKQPTQTSNDEWDKYAVKKKSRWQRIKQWYFKYFPIQISIRFIFISGEGKG